MKEGGLLKEDFDLDDEIHAKDVVARKAAETALRESNTKFAKWMRQDRFLEDRERMNDVIFKIRQRSPDLAAIVDKQVDSIPTGYLLQELQREYPEVSQNKLTDLEVFDFLMQFVSEKDTDPNFQYVRNFLEKEELRKKEHLREERAIASETASIHSKHFGAAFQSLSYDEANMPEEQRVPVNDPALLADPDSSFTDLVSLIHKELDSLPTKEEFFAGVDPSNKEAYRRRNAQWNEFVELYKLSQQSKALDTDDPTPDQEPIIEAVTDFDRIYRASSVGKYIRWAQREQKKYLTEGWCGKLEHREFAGTKETSLMMRTPVLQTIAKLQEAEAASFGPGAPLPTVFYGDAGVGKSACLQLVVYWARKSGWLVVNIKNATKWAHSGGQIVKSKRGDGLWDQPYLGVKFLGHMLDSHADKLKQIPIRTDISGLGKFEGKTLFDLVEFGAALHEFSCDVIVIFKKELQRVIEFPVLIAIDDYNSLYNYSQAYRDPDPIFDGTKFAPPKLKNSKLTLCRIFMDSHIDPKLANGTFVGAVSREVSYRNFPIEVNKGPEWIEVPPYSIYETNQVYKHYERSGYIASKISTGTRQVLHQLYSGRGAELFKWANFL